MSPDAMNLGALLRGGLRLTTAEVVAIVHGVCVEASTGAARAVPAQADEISITRDGRLLITAPPDGGNGRRAAVAGLLERLLPQSSDGAEFAVPDALRTLPSRLRPTGNAAGKDDLRYLLLILSKYLPANAAGLIEHVARRAREGSAAHVETQGPTSTMVARQAPVTPPPTNVVASPFASESTTGESTPIRNSRPIAPESRIADLPLHVEGPTVSTPPRPVAIKGSIPLVAGAVLLMALSGFVGYRVRSNAVERATPATTSKAESPSLAAEPRIVESDRPQAAAKGSTEDASPAPLDLPVPNGAFSPSLSGNGTLLFHAGRNTSGQLFTATVDDHGGVTAPKPLIADGARNYHPRLSPDGTRVAFDSDRDGQRAVYIADRNGTGITRVSGAGYAAVPSWSPDGARLAFIKAEPQSPRVWNLWLLNVRTGELHRHTAFRSGQVWGASWFPDGHSIAYSHEDRLIVSDLQSGANDVQASPVKGRQVRTPSVSPDGHRIVFQVYGNGVWMLDLATGAVRRVLNDVTAEEFAWDPSGRRIAYHSRRAGKWQIWMMPS